MFTRYDIKWLEENVDLFKFGTHPDTGLNDVATMHELTVCSGLTDEQVQQLSGWSKRVLQLAYERRAPRPNEWSLRS